MSAQWGAREQSLLIGRVLHRAEYLSVLWVWLMAALRRTWLELPLLCPILNWGSPQRNDLSLRTVTDPECMSAGHQITACLTACQKVCSWRRIWAAHLHTYRKNDKHPQPKGTLKNLCFPLIIRFAISLCTSVKQTKNNTLNHQRPSILIACHFRGAKIQKKTHRTDEIWYLLYFLLTFQRRKCSSCVVNPLSFLYRSLGQYHPELWKKPNSISSFF